MQLLTVVIPKLEQWQKQGELGIKKINQATRYVTIALALLQSTGLVFLFHSQSSALNGIDIFPPGTFDAPHIALIVLTLTAGTALIMWLGELITQRGIGNGMSILIFASIISRLPAEGGAPTGLAAGSIELTRGILDAAMSVYLDRFLNVPAARLPQPDQADPNPNRLLKELPELAEDDMPRRQIVIDAEQYPRQ